VFGLIALILLIAYGIKQAYTAVQARSRRAEAVQYTNQAVHALNSGNIEAATNSLKAAQMIAPPDTPEATSAARDMSNVEIHQAQQETASGDAAGAQASYQLAIQQYQKNAEAYDGRANLRWSQHDENGAIDDWQNAMRADASSPAANDARARLTQIFQARAQSAADAHNYTEARSDWQQIISINPGSTEAQQAQQNISNSPLPGQQ
jgi:tetratricopeptide (TPR) repeat protein